MLCFNIPFLTKETRTTLFQLHIVIDNPLAGE